MIIYGVYSVLTEDSQVKLGQFFQGCPVEIKLPLLYELGTSVTNSFELASPSVVYEVVPLSLNVRYNPRTGRSALFWDLESLSPETARRQEALGTALIKGEDYDNSSQYNSVVLAQNIHAYNRRMKAYFNSKADTQDSLINLGDPLTLEFEGEIVVEFEVPNTSVARSR